MTHAATTAARGHYYVPAASRYSTYLSVGVFLTALGFIFKINGTPSGVWSMLAGAALITYVVVGWLDVRPEYHVGEDSGCRWIFFCPDICLG
jgi:cytochrome c oxidase subunit 3